MKRILHVLMGLVCPVLLVAQAPPSFNYQAVARDQGNQILANESLTLRFTILEADSNGTAVYQEEHDITTNDFGLFSAAVGDGTVISGTFASIGWGSNAHYLQVEVNDGSGFADLGTNQLLSVPYAMYANSSGSSGGYSAGGGISISNNVISNTGDTDPSDDITNNTSAIGDVSGTFPSLTVTGLQNRPVANTQPNSGEVLKWNGSAWAPAEDQQGSGGSGSSPWNSSGSDIYYNSGNVGIGISNPTTALDVKGTMELSTGGANNEDFAIGVNPNGALSFYPNNDYSEDLFYFDDTSPFFTIDNHGSNPSGYRLFQNGGIRGALIYDPADNIANFTRDVRFARVALDADNNVVIAGTDGDNEAALTVNSQYKNGRIKMGSQEYIEDGGAMWIGMGGSPIPSEDDQYSLGISTRRWTEVFAVNGVINTSDATAKRNIASVNYGIDDIMQLAPVRYQMKEDEFEEPHLGFLAQDLLEVFPEVVKTHDEIIDEETGEVSQQKAEVLGVYYHRLIPILVKSMQQQQMKIDALENEIESLKKDH